MNSIYLGDVHDLRTGVVSRSNNRKNNNATADFGDVPDNPQDKKEERQRDKATSAFNSFSRRFDDERAVAGSNLWNAFNAYSGLVQHDMKARGKNDADRIEKRVTSNLFGLNSERINSAIQLAYAMAN